MLVFRADVPEEVKRKEKRRRTPMKKAAQPVGATLSNELRFRKVVNVILRGAATLIKEKGLPEVQSAKEQLAVDHHTMTDTTFGISIFGQQLRSYFDQHVASLPRWVRPILDAEEATHRLKFTSTVKATFAVDVSSVVRASDVASHLDAAMLNSINQIKGMTDEMAKRVQTVLMQGALQGKRSEELAKSLSKQFEWSLKRSKTIARDQLATFNGALNEVRQKQTGFEEYIWSTTIDGRERPEHAERDGKVFSWDDPPDDGHPGFPINCRCVARAYVNTGR